MTNAQVNYDQLFEDAGKHALDGRIAEAVNLYRVILRDRPDDVNTHHKLGGLFLEIGHIESATPHLKKAYEASGGREMIWIRYVKALLASKHVGEARHVLNEGAQKWGFTGANVVSLNSDWYAAQQASAADPTKPVPLPDIADPEFYAVLSKAWPYSMSSVYGFVESFYSLYQSVNYIVNRGIPGAFVECGSYMGGMSMLAALTFMKRGDTDRHIYLLDTFEGMPPPTTEDGAAMARAYDRNTQSNAAWAKADAERVRTIMHSSGYPADKIHLVKGMVEDTIPGSTPEKVAILRLDTDLYESYKHAMTHLYPRLAPGGVLVLDDYGCMPGAKRAVDEYFSSVSPPILLSRVNSTVYTGIKA